MAATLKVHKWHTRNVCVTICIPQNSLATCTKPIRTHWTRYSALLTPVLHIKVGGGGWGEDAICHVSAAIKFHSIPYSRKLLREKTFADRWKIRFSQRKLSQIARFCSTKGRYAPKFRGENLRESPQNREICECFLPQKFSAIYGNLNPTYHTDPGLLMHCTVFAYIQSRHTISAMLCIATTLQQPTT